MNSDVLIAIIGDLSKDTYDSCLNQGNIINVVDVNDKITNFCKTLVLSKKDKPHILEIIKYSIQEKYNYLYLMNNNTLLNDSCIESHRREYTYDNSYSDYNYILHKERHGAGNEHVVHREYLFSIEPKLLNKAKQTIHNVCLYIPKIANIASVLKKDCVYDIIVAISQLNCSVNHIPHSLYKVKI